MTARDYLERHAIDPTLAHKLGVGVHNGALTFRYTRLGGRSFERRKPLDGGLTFQPKGEPLCLYWPAGRNPDRKEIILCEGEADCLAAATVIASDLESWRNTLPVGLPGLGMPTLRILSELADRQRIYVVLDADLNGRGQRKQAQLIRSGRSAPPPGPYPVSVELEEGQDLSDTLAEVPEDSRSVFLADLLADAEAADPYSSRRAA